MASITLAESAKLAQDELLSGVIESVVTTDDFFQLLPFKGIEGNAHAYTRENAPGPVATVGVGQDIGPNAAAGNNLAARQAAADAATFTKVSVELTTILGQAEVNGLIQSTRSADNDQTAGQLASKAKSAGRQYRDMLINGVAGATNEFEGLLSLVPAGQKVTTAANGSNLSFAIMDELMDKVKDKDGDVDYFQMPARTIRSYLALLRALGGASINDVMELPNGKKVPMYRGVPIFKNDNIPTDQVQGASGAVCTSIFAGNFDDGSGEVGVTGLTSRRAAGMKVKYVGEHLNKDEEIWRVVWYCGLALYSELGIASAPGILD